MSAQIGNFIFSSGIITGFSTQCFCKISCSARLLGKNQFHYLCSFDDGAPPSTCQIIRQLGIGKTRFYRYRNELEAFGLIEVENTITSGGGVAKYSFPDKPVPTAEAEEILINRLINNNNKAMNFKKERNDENAGEHN